MVFAVFFGGNGPQEFDSRALQPQGFDPRDMPPVAVKFVERKEGVQNPIIAPRHVTALLTTPSPVAGAASIAAVMISTMTGCDSPGCAVEPIVINTY